MKPIAYSRYYNAITAELVFALLSAKIAIDLRNKDLASLAIKKVEGKKVELYKKNKK